MQVGQLPHGLWEKLYGSPSFDDIIDSLQGSTPLKDLSGDPTRDSMPEDCVSSPWKLPQRPASPRILFPPPPMHVTAPPRQPQRLLPCRALHADFANAGDMFT